MLLVACMDVHADERCGAHSAIEPLLNRGLPGYLAEDFKSLLKPAKSKPKTPVANSIAAADSNSQHCDKECPQGCLKAPEVVAADIQPSSLAQPVDQVVKPIAQPQPAARPEATGDHQNTDRHLLPRNVVVSKKAIPYKQPQTCVLRDLSLIHI